MSGAHNGGTERYRTIVADPAWKVKRPTGWNSTENHRDQSYPTMTVEEIAALPVGELADAYAFAFVWTVNAHVEAAYHVMRCWGFRPVTLLTWCKEPRGMGPGGMFATTSEFVLYGRRGIAPNGRDKAIDRSWFTWPRRGQSEKPEAFFDLIEEHFPGPYLELFARRQRLGWDTWGNEALEHVTLTPREVALREVEAGR